MSKKNVLVVREDKETVDKIARGLESKRKIFEILGDVGKTVTKVAKPGFICSLLSPFDIEGPIIEIVTGAALAAGYIMERISKSNIEKIDAIITNGEASRSVKLDESDVRRIANAMSHMHRGVEERRFSR